MKFSEVIGQEEAQARLVSMAEEGRLPHAMLLCGPTGCGKMAIALAFASYLLGEREETDELLAPPKTPAQINAEAMLKQWQHPDLHFSYPVIRPAGTPSEYKMTSDDFAREWHDFIIQGPYFSLDQWLDAMKAANQQANIFVGESESIIRKLSIKSSQGGYKVCLVWLPERMNLDCANKLLKILEEPPSQTVFIMVCEQPELLLETIRSRTQRIDIKKIDNQAVEQALILRRGIEPDMARRIARVANGNWLKALQELETDNENRMFLDLFISLMRLAYTRKIKELKNWSDTAALFGREKQKRMLSYFLRLLRENFIFNFGNAEICYMTQEEENFAKNFSPYINEANIIELNELFSLAIRDIGQNANAKIVFFDMVLRVTVLLIQK